MLPDYWRLIPKINCKSKKNNCRLAKEDRTDARRLLVKNQKTKETNWIDGKERAVVSKIVQCNELKSHSLRIIV